MFTICGHVDMHSESPTKRPQRVSALT